MALYSCSCSSCSADRTNRHSKAWRPRDLISSSFVRVPVIPEDGSTLPASDA